MLITLEGDKPLRGDLIKIAVLRSHCVAVPLSLEAEIRLDDSIDKALAEGKTLIVGSDTLRIIKVEKATTRQSQGVHSTNTIKVIAILDNCHQLAFIKDKAIILNNTTLSEIYKACGASIKAIKNDVSIPAFVCFKGDYATPHIARCIQEAGGIVRWKNGELQFFRLADLFKQNSETTLPSEGLSDFNSGFLERHLVPSFISTQADGSAISGNTDKPRKVSFSPNKNEQELRNMTRCLVLKKKSKIYYANKIVGGDLLSIQGEKPLVAVTAVHVWKQAEQYTELFLYNLVN